MNPIISHFQATVLKNAHAQGIAEVAVSLDLGLTEVTVFCTGDGIVLPNKECCSWDSINRIIDHPNGCFCSVNSEVQAIKGFSELTGRTYSLMPTAKAPTMLISGVLMHRIKDINPYDASKAMVQALMPLHGRILDTATGLGYCAIEIAKSASEVTTIELDPAAQDMCRNNPWSQELFSNKKIVQKIGDSSELIHEFANGFFTAVLHDPPVFNLAGELYAGAFYREVYRVLAPRGKMFHYIGDPESVSGARVTKGVIERLRDAGFKKVIPKPRAFGVLALK